MNNDKGPSYNRYLYGDPQYTPDQTIERLKSECCFDKLGRLFAWPQWFTAAELFTTLEAGLLKSVTYTNLRSHTDYYIAG